MKTVASVLVVWMPPWRVVLAGTPSVDLAKKDKPGKPWKPADLKYGLGSSGA